MAGLAMPCGGRGATALPIAGCGGRGATALPPVGSVPSLNYWCTWSMQGMTRRLPEWHRKVAAIVGETILPGDILAKIGSEAAPADIYSSPGTLIFNKQRS